MKTFYFTFGINHKDHHGKSLFGYFTTIEALNEEEARRIMFERFGKNYEFLFDNADTAGVYRNNLTYVDFDLIAKKPPQNEDIINLFQI